MPLTLSSQMDSNHFFFKHIADVFPAWCVNTHLYALHYSSSWLMLSLLEPMEAAM